MSESEKINQLSDAELEELTSPDDNPDEADVDDSAQHMQCITMICGIVAAVLAIAAGVWLGVHLHNKHTNSCAKRFDHILDHVDDAKDRMEAVRGHVGQTLRQLPSDVRDVATNVKDAIID